MREGPPVVSVSILRSSAGNLVSMVDSVVAEEPLEIIIKHGNQAARRSFPLAVTMRTPGQDQELATGFLFTENVIQKKRM